MDAPAVWRIAEGRATASSGGLLVLWIQEKNEMGGNEPASTNAWKSATAAEPVLHKETVGTLSMVRTREAHVLPRG